MLPNKHLIIAIDFDGTIVEDSYPKIGKPLLFSIETIKKLQSEGHRLILWTYRTGKRLKEAVEFCKKEGIEFYSINKSYPEEELDSKTSRKIHADLFIDTFNCNAHTTASDALWAGLPVVTKQGSQFAARVSASLLNSIGLSELIVNTQEEYEALVLELATDTNRLNALKSKLARNRLTKPLFDTKQYARHFEIGLRQAYDRYFEGKKAVDIWVHDDPVRPQ